MIFTFIIIYKLRRILNLVKVNFFMISKISTHSLKIAIYCGYIRVLDLQLVYMMSVKSQAIPLHR